MSLKEPRVRSFKLHGTFHSAHLTWGAGCWLELVGLDGLKLLCCACAVHDSVRLKQAMDVSYQFRPSVICPWLLHLDYPRLSLTAWRTPPRST